MNEEMSEEQARDLSRLRMACILRRHPGLTAAGGIGIGRTSVVLDIVLSGWKL